MGKLFMIDDDAIFKKLASVILKREFPDCEIECLQNGLEAINRFKKMKEEGEEFPQFVFLDINMPVMNGWEFLDELKSYPEIIEKRMCIHMLSSSIAAEDLNKAKEYSYVHGYITKPLMREDISNLRATG